jgi:hypothetical protein
MVLEMIEVPQLVKKFPTLYGCGSSLTYAQEPITGPHIEPDLNISIQNKLRGL